ncbi:hypothetical protein [Nocardia camponoti]|uniref:Uncharacterized protein n=1 Tax=Nocardia camponoti TaxID=1616106 RepID=A0A917QQB6_9NOCA|nr:hypothetical protein [Nocardia camponoti]GGK62718.1 hypothetical protein GCM10011591_38710 [Nocardia camponoti]
MANIASWWDGFELWVAGLPFIPQFLVVLLGMVPVSFALAYLLDRALRAAFRLLGRGDDAAPAELTVEELVGPVRPTVGSGVR